MSFASKIGFVIPHSWASCGNHNIANTNAIGYDDTPVKVASTHPVFGADIWTQQQRPCGKPGDFTYIPWKWLNNNKMIRGMN